MKTALFPPVLVWLLAMSCSLRAQEPQSPPPGGLSRDSADIKLPNGRSLKDEILKADHAKNIDDAYQLSRLARELRHDLEKNSQFVFSLEDLKKTEEIEKLAKRIRSRMKRF